MEEQRPVSLPDALRWVADYLTLADELIASLLPDEDTNDITDDAVQRDLYETARRIEALESHLVITPIQLASCWPRVQTPEGAESKDPADWDVPAS